jgi:hypothetical protein
MEKEFIPYEQALALKELGFDKSCLRQWIWSSLRRSHYLSDEWLPTSGKIVLAPLYQQTFRWFREKYDTSSFVKRDFKDTKMIGYYYGIEGTKNDEYSKTYDSYEEAELECLIKLIEIVKENKL